VYYATGGNTQKQAANRMAITSREMGIRLPSDCDGLQRVVRLKLGAGRCFRALDGVFPRTVVP